MSIQHSRGAYEAAVISDLGSLFGPSPHTAQPCMSDEDRDNEIRAQNIFYAALGRFRAEVVGAIPLTDLRRDALDDLLATLEDATPSRTAWDEAISDSRRGA